MQVLVGLDVDTKVFTVRALATVCAAFYEQEPGTVSPYVLPRELVEGISDRQAIKSMKG